MPQGSPAASSLATLSEVPGTELRQLQATFASFRDFVARYSPWLSDSCIFIETLEEVPVGAPVRLEIWLRDRPALILALGQVDWVREPSGSDEEGPPGVALNITYLDPASTRLIDSIFRLYTGQQSAAMGKDVVETWELDVESLIDQAFPGAPGAAEGGADPRQAASGVTPPPAAPPQPPPVAAAPRETAPPDGSAATGAAPSRPVQIMADDGTAGETLGWSSPDAEPSAAEAPPPSEVQIMADDGTAGDALGWSSPDTGPIDVDALPSAAAGDEVADLAQEVEIELPASLDDLPEIEVEAQPTIEEPAVPEEAHTIEAPALEDAGESPLPAAPEETAALSPEAEIELPAPPSFETPSPVSPEDLTELEAPLGMPLPGSETSPDDEWEERFSAAFSEHEAEPPAEDTGFGFGLVPESEPPAEEALPPLDDQALAEVPLSAAPAAEAELSRPEPPPAEASSRATPPPAVPDQAEQAIPAHPLAGAAAATSASDASFLRRSVLLFLAAVIAIGLLFVWLRGRPEPPAEVATIAETPAGSEGAGEAATPPAETAGGSEATSTAPGPAEAQTGEAQTGEAQTGPPTEPASEPGPVESGPVESAPVESAPAAETPVPAVEPLAPPPPAATTEDPAEIAAAVERRVKAWADAWSRKQPEDYVACYAPDYRPAGTGRQEWIRQRRIRIRAPTNILVQAKDISVEVIGAGRANATFYQDYETDTKHLYTWKTMELARLPDGWRIVLERVGR